MKKLLFLLLLSLQVLLSHANNIQVTNVLVQPATNTIQFTVSWDNGWRSSILNNWDAAYVFIKFKDVDNTWKHLNFTNVGNTVPSGFTADFTSPQYVAVLLHRSATGSGTTTITNAQLGIPAARATGIYDIKVFAIEMVYVPQGSFFVGDGVSGTGRYGVDATLAAGGQITQNGSSPGVYDPLAVSNLSSLNTVFPNGYNAFYCMKYELTQGGYRDFLNTLTYNQQVNHTVAAPSSPIGKAALVVTSGTNRSYLEIKTPGTASTLPAEYGCDGNNNDIFDEPADGEWVACNFTNWPDMAAYLAWAGLRPLSELEYEKAARGIQLPTAGEYAWGNANIATVVYTLTNPNQNSETVGNGASSPTGNAGYASTILNLTTNGPLRNGIFATATSNKISSGGGFYGIMELSGNLYERVVSTYLPGFPFSQYTYFETNLSLQGYAILNGVSPGGLQPGWPGQNSLINPPFFYTITGSPVATGLMDRGGSWSHLSTFLRVSDRDVNLIYTNNATARDNYHGIRGAITVQ